MNSYQLTLLVNPKVEEKERKELLDSLTKSFGKLIKEDLWGNKNLSYPIKHIDKAYYAYYEFESDPSSIASLDKSLKLNEDIIRYLLIRK